MKTDMKTSLRLGFDETLGRVRESLTREGFGVLTEIDMQETLKKKIGAEIGRYRILGACNPPIAHRALRADLDAGLMMPCNVIVYEGADGRTVVVAIDPAETQAARSGPPLEGIVREVREKLVRVLATLS